MSDWPGFDPDNPEDWIRPPDDDDAPRQEQEGTKRNGPGTDDLTPIPWQYRDPTTIPPRRWLIGTTLLSGYATVIASMGGVGKTAYAIALALAYITGRRDILDQHVFQTGKIWFITLEDDREELERRIAAAMLAHGISRHEIEGRLFVNTASERTLLLAKVGPTGNLIVCEDAERLVEAIKTNGIGVTVIDPLVRSHALAENSNEHMDRLIAIANDTARTTRTAVLLTAHFRKGGGEDGARDAIRGGSALIDGARIVRTLVPASPEEVKAFKVAPHDAFRFVRVADAKANLAPRERAIWFELVSIPLGNTGIDPAHPNGDNVQAAKAWKPPAALDGIDLLTLERIFARLREGPGSGWFYSPEPRAKYWGGTVIVEEAGNSKAQAGTYLKAWVANDVLRTINYKTPNRDDGIKLVINDAKVADILAPIRGFGPNGE